MIRASASLPSGGGSPTAKGPQPEKMKQKPLHPAIDIPAFDHLLKVQSATGLESFIGAKVKYKDWTPQQGTLAKTEVYIVGSIQKIYDGSFAFRVYATSYNDTFGRPMKLNEAEIVSTN